MTAHNTRTHRHKIGVGSGAEAEAREWKESEAWYRQYERERHERIQRDGWDHLMYPLDDVQENENEKHSE